ncbi:MAG: hypothetical protein JWQ40_946 [Segetibacter sp.]|nr:hypothetical protein [Segetibacter sp.]
MPNKSFSFYPSTQESSVDTFDELVIELGKSFIAVMLVKGSKKSVAAFELFTFDEEETTDFKKLFSEVLLSSKVLENHSLPAKVYINNNVTLLVPVFKFNKEIAADYLDVVFGEDRLSAIQFEHIPVEPGMMNVYRIAEDWFTVLNTYFPKTSFKHSWSNTIRTLTDASNDFPGAFISVQFYNTSITVVAMKDKQLHLIQSFVYENPEDVLYYLLNITERLELDGDQLQLQISGMIDLDFKLYRELVKYFKNVTVENTDRSKVLPDTGEHPLHYFTPFFNLAI